MEIKIKIIPFWNGFNPRDNFLTRVIREKYDIEFSETPDYLFVSSLSGLSHFKYENCVKIYFTGENDIPDFNLFDYAIGYNFLSFSDRYFRLPLYLLSEGYKELNNKKISERLLHRKFCSFVVSTNHYADPIRNLFFEALSNYRVIDSGGRFKNNVGGPVKNKLEFITNYKFNLAFENSACCGYTTEKILEPMRVNSIPIYWGNSLISKDFNVKSFVNVMDYNSIDDAIEYIRYLDTNDDAYMQKLSEPWLNNTRYLDWEQQLQLFLSNIFNKRKEDAIYTHRYGWTSIYYNRMKSLKLTDNKLCKLITRVL